MVQPGLCSFMYMAILGPYCWKLRYFKAYFCGSWVDMGNWWGFIRIGTSCLSVGNMNISGLCIIMIFYIASFLLVHVQTSSVNAIPNPGFIFWSIIEHVSKMTVTIPTPNLRPNHSMTHVLNLLDVGPLILIVKGWPTTTTIEFEDGIKECLSTDNAGVGSLLIGMLILACHNTLCYLWMVVTWLHSVSLPTGASSTSSLAVPWFLLGSLFFGQKN